MLAINKITRRRPNSSVLGVVQEILAVMLGSYKEIILAIQQAAIRRIMFKASPGK
jgi:hypothetical protein